MVGVRNLISGDGKQAVLPELGNHINIRDVWVPEFYLQIKDVLLNKVENVCGGSKNYASTTGISQEVQSILADTDPYRQCKATVLPSFINNSMYWGDGFGENAGRTIYNVFKSLSPPSIVVTAAGNLVPTPVPPYKAKASKNFDVIIVGNLTCEGRRSGSSQQGEEVHIMAPGSEQLSADKNGNLMSFGGTSGATPLVTGSLAGFEWLSGYHPTPEEAKILLEKTAVPTHHSHDVPRLNGVGMVNAYKLGMVGEEFKRLCGKNISCFKRMIRDPAAYWFPEDSDLEEAVEQVFPECSQTCGKDVQTCADKDKVFKRLRKAVFLNPSSKKLWRYKACIYNSGDFPRIAKGAINTYKALFGPPQNGKEAHTVCKSDSDCTLVPASCLAENRVLHSTKPVLHSTKPVLQQVNEEANKVVKSMANVGLGDSDSATTNEGFVVMSKAEAEIQYATGQCKGVLCNGKCRCDNEETHTIVSYRPL